MVGTEIHVAGSRAITGVVDRFHAQPFPTHAPVYYLVAATGVFGSDVTVGTKSEEMGWMRVPEHVRLARDHYIARVDGHPILGEEVGSPFFGLPYLYAFRRP